MRKWFDGPAAELVPLEVNDQTTFVSSSAEVAELIVVAFTSYGAGYVACRAYGLHGGKGHSETPAAGAGGLAGERAAVAGLLEHRVAGLTA